jgi:effector-binding domain-containing protein
MNSFILEKGKHPSGPPRELYLSDPILEKDTAKWLTEIVFPVQ